MDRETINIPAIALEGSEWIAWDGLKENARHGGGVRVPNKRLGVYDSGTSTPTSAYT